MKDWASVDDRLPIVSEPEQVIIFSGDMPLCGVFDGRDFFELEFWISEADSPAISDEVTHWMPLPAPPTEDMCKCGKNPQQPPHTCPYEEEIFNNSETMCECCDSCQHECLLDI